MREDPGLNLALSKAGGPSALSRALNIAPSSVSNWKRVPAHRVGQLCRLLSLRKEELRPDLVAQVDLRLAPPVPGATDIAARLIARGHLAAVSAEIVVAEHFGLSGAEVARTQGRPRRLAIYVAATAIESVCRTTIARHFAVSHQAASKTMEAVCNQRDKDDALDELLDDLCDRTRARFGKYRG